MPSYRQPGARQPGVLGAGKGQGWDGRMETVPSTARLRQGLMAPGGLTWGPEPWAWKIKKIM